MREIKFRVFDNGKIYYFSLFDLHSNYIVDDSHSISKEAKKNIMQYTGLKDKNGVEIFEGDIVTYTMENKTTLTLEIKYEEELARFYIRGRYDISHIIFSLTIDAILDADIEVIGNIYENKDMLNENTSY